MSYLLRAYTHALHAKPYTVTSVSCCFCYATGDLLAQYIEKCQNKRTTYDLHRTTVMSVFALGIAGPIYCLWYKKIHNINKFYESLAKWNYTRQLKARLVNKFSAHIKDGTIENMSMKTFIDNNKISFSQLNNEMVFKSKTILAGQVYADQFIFSVIYPVIFMMCSGIMIDNTKYEDWEYFKINKRFNTEKIKLSWKNNWQNVKNKYLSIYMTDCMVWPLAQILNFAFVPDIYQPIFVNFLNIFWNAFICYTSQGGH